MIYFHCIDYRNKDTIIPFTAGARIQWDDKWFYLAILGETSYRFSRANAGVLQFIRNTGLSLPDEFLLHKTENIIYKLGKCEDSYWL